MAYLRYEVILNGNLITTKALGKSESNEELEDNIKNMLLDSSGYPEGLEEQITVKLLERREE